MQTTIEASIMVGDSKNDILSANALSMDSIGLTYGYNYGEKIEYYQPTVVVEDFADLLRLLP
jgi:phosphoglycolate phosphatase